MTTPTRPVRGGTDLDVVRAALDEEYEVLAELGRGGMAVVYRARERMLDRAVALKVLPFSLAHDDALVERFQREARTAAQLEHPHIIPIYRVGRSEQVIYFVMKLLRGLSLSDRLLEQGRLSAADTRRVLTETASALGYSHARGVVHRDVKPDNILFDEDGRCIVTDFGIARSSSDSALTATGMSMGTPRYMSPEQARARQVDGRSDLYSLGVVGYQCLTGRLPFDGDDMMAILLAHVSNPVPRPSGLDAEQRAIYAVVERMLAKDPAARFQSADEVIAALVGAPAAPMPATASGDEAPRYGAPGSGPRSSAALDRALEAGVEMLKQQKPKVDAALNAGAELLKQQRPKVDASVAAGKRIVAENAPKVRSAAGTVWQHVSERLAQARAFEAANRRRVWATAASAVVLWTGLYYSVHFALHHRTRCPRVGAGDSTSVPPAFRLLVDDGGSIRHNGDADVYYDVCGLEKGAGFTTRVVITKSESGLRRFLGDNVEPVAAKYEETAGGAAVRRHRSLDMDGMPSGSYWVSVIVTDDKGRRREEGTSLRVRGE